MVYKVCKTVDRLGLTLYNTTCFAPVELLGRLSVSPTYP